MKRGKEGQTKFIATVDEHKIPYINKIAQALKKDGITVDTVSTLFGIITGNAPHSLEELKLKYGPRGIKIEPDREVSI